MTKRTVCTEEVVGDEIIRTLEIHQPRTIQFQDILDAVEIVSDNDGGKPWDNCDGYEHELVSPSWREHESRIDNARNSIVLGSGLRGNSRRFIELDDKIVDDCVQYARKSGASKQIAFEFGAYVKRQTLEQLKTWYQDGWEYFGVQCEFMDEEDSCYGIDSYEFARGEMRTEIAGNVAHALEQRGFIVVGMPTKEQRQVEYRKNRRDSLRRNMQMFTWKD